MKKPCIAFGAAVVLAAQVSTLHATEFKNAVVGQIIADRTLTIGKLSMQLPSSEWILAAKTSEFIGTSTGINPRLQTLVAAQTHDKTVSAVVIFSAPASSLNVSRWPDDPCKSVTSFLVKSTLNQTTDMPECFVIAPHAAGSFHVSTEKPYQELVRWAYDTGHAFPDPMIRVFYTKYRFGDYFKLNAYFAGGRDAKSAAETWGREAATSLAAMIARSTAQGKLPELPAFATALAGAPPSPAANVQPSATGANAAPNSAESRLRQLKSLLDSNLITPAEYEGKRKKIVEEM